MRPHLTALLLALAASPPAAGAPSDGPPPRDVHMVYMGGNDCPPCVAWRKDELPKLQRTAAFKGIRFSHVDKSIRSAVPPSFFLPEEVRHYKAQLDAASGGNTGSPQTAILVNGKVYDYYFGSRSAADIEAMLLAIQDRTPYPWPRCVRRGARWSCEDGG